MTCTAAVARVLTPLVAAVCGLAVATGCGSDSETSKPDVASRVVQADVFLGFPVLPGLEGEVRTDPEPFISGSPFPLYLDTNNAITALRNDGFVAGIVKIFKATQGVGASGNIVVQMRDAKAAAAERARQVARVLAMSCPVKCTKNTERFEVPGLPGATGIDNKQTLAHAETAHGTTFRVTHDFTIVFTKGAFVYQVYVGGAGIERKRVGLVAAARALYERAP